MNKRQRRKTEKNLRDFIDKKILERQEIEVGDTVEVLNNSLGGFPTGKVVRVVERPLHAMKIDSSKCYVTDVYGDNPYDPYAMIHRVSELKLIKKGPKK